MSHAKASEFSSVNLTADKKHRRFFIDPALRCNFHGKLNETAVFLERVQLLDTTTWARFVEQFRLQPDGEDRGWRGEYWGKMMRGASFVYSYTRNPALYQVLCNTVEDMLKTQEENGRISSYPSDTEFNGWDLWCRKYVLLGMQYFLEICEDNKLCDRIISSMMRQADYLLERIGNTDGKRRITTTSHFWGGLNSSSILEPFVRLYHLTKQQRYLDFAAYIVDCGGCEMGDVFELAYEDITDPYQYPVTKAYELISCFEGLLEYYRATGIEKYRDAVIRFARRLAKTDITIIGCAGCTHELLDHSKARQTDTAYRGIMQETCVTVTWMKFCMQLLLLTGEAEFADYFEQSLYNAYLGSVNSQQKTDTAALAEDPQAILQPLPFDSYSALLSGVRGNGIGGLKIMPDKHYYGCCACIGAAGIGMLQKMAAMRQNNGIIINLYENGILQTVTPKGNPLTLTMKTGYPKDGQIEISVETVQAEEFSLTVRIPSWSQAATVTCEKTAFVKSGYHTIQRIWNNNDKIVLQFDMRTKVLSPTPLERDIIMTHTARFEACMIPRVVVASEHAKDHIALQRGPLILARDARLGENIDEVVEIAYDADSFVAVTESSRANFENMVEFSIPCTNGKQFTVIDYGSAGKTMDEVSRYACWFPTKPY